MARINYPEDFIKQTILFKTMKAKHDGDAAGSPITPFLTQKGIDLAADETATDEALAHHSNFVKTARKAEDHTEDRNNLFEPVMERLKKELQFLKKFYAGNTHELGDWGATIDEERIVYPPDFLSRAQLLKDVHEKHNDFSGGTSPLSPFLTQNEIDLDADLADTTAAEVIHALKEQAKKDAEKYSEARHDTFSPVINNLRAIGAYLKSLYVSSQKKLGDWGYEVDDSARPPQWRTAAIAPDNSRTLTGVKLNSQAENTGTVELLLHKGEAIGEEPVALPPEMRFTIKRGWGTITVQNTDQTEEGEIGYLTTSGLN